MLGRQHLRINRFSMFHASALMVLLAIGMSMDARIATTSVTQTSQVQMVPDQGQVYVIRATVWKLIQCDETKEVDV